jgi:DNA-binding beta-propeller fold protein YncE
VAAVLGDALRRVSVLGGREGMPRSLGSVYSSSVARFLGACFEGVQSRVISMSAVRSFSNGIAVSRDGSTLLVSDMWDGSHAIREFSATGSWRRYVGGKGSAPLKFNGPGQVCIAPDGFVFVADCNNNRVQVLTPSLDFHGFVGAGHLAGPCGVCANADVVVVSEVAAHRISVFSRRDGALLRRFGHAGRGDGQLMSPHGLCFASDDRHVAVAEHMNSRVSVFTVDGGEFVRHVGVGELKLPYGVACSGFDELVVADTGNRRVVLFSASGSKIATIGHCAVTGIAMHGGAVFAMGPRDSCVVFTG